MTEAVVSENTTAPARCEGEQAIDGGATSWSLGGFLIIPESRNQRRYGRPPGNREHSLRSGVPMLFNRLRHLDAAMEVR